MSDSEDQGEVAPDLSEPSTEKEPDEEPEAPAEAPVEDDPEPSHHAVGIGVIGGPQTLQDGTSDT